MTIQESIFLWSVALIAFAYFGYPVLIWLLARIAPNPVRLRGKAPNSVSVVIAAYNEAGSIQRRISELLKSLDSLSPGSEIVIVSDGSTDGTDRLAREVRDLRVRVIQQPHNAGKAIALNTGVAAARNPIVVFGDSRQRWNENTIHKMLANFADPDVGAVGGDLVLHNKDGSLAGVGLYWKLEKWMRRSESLLHSSVQVAGAIGAVRRHLYKPIPAGTILDDVCWPIGISMQGYRVIQEPAAQAFDQLPDTAADEVRRKVRTLSGNFQLVARKPEILLPWRNPVWFHFICHKLLRLVVPWAMLAALLASALSDKLWLQIALVIQAAGYLCGFAATYSSVLGRNRIANAISSLLVLNYAAFVAWFVYFSGRADRSWKKVAYRDEAQSVSTQTPAAGAL